MKIMVGDITKIRGCQVIVNPANGCGICGAGVAGAIASSGGENVRKFAKAAYEENGKPFEPGEVYITDAALLKRIGFKKIYHGVVMKFPGGPTNIEIVEKVCKNVMQKAMINKVKSIVFPGLGTGIGRLDKRQVANRMVAILESYSDSIDITITDLDDNFVHSLKEFVKSETT